MADIRFFVPLTMTNVHRPVHRYLFEHPLRFLGFARNDIWALRVTSSAADRHVGLETDFLGSQDAWI